jgi:hypothetical protein
MQVETSGEKHESSFEYFLTHCQNHRLLLFVNNDLASVNEMF